MGIGPIRLRSGKTLRRGPGCWTFKNRIHRIHPRWTCPSEKLKSRKEDSLLFHLKLSVGRWTLSVGRSLVERSEKTSSSEPFILGLPHRPPFVFVHAVVKCDPGVAAECATTFEGNDPMFAGHLLSTSASTRNCRRSSTCAIVSARKTMRSPGRTAWKNFIWRMAESKRRGRDDPSGLCERFGKNYARHERIVGKMAGQLVLNAV